MLAVSYHNFMANGNGNHRFWSPCLLGPSLKSKVKHGSKNSPNLPLREYNLEIEMDTKYGFGKSSFQI